MFPSLVKPTFSVYRRGRNFPLTEAFRNGISRAPPARASARVSQCKIADFLRLWPRLDWPNRLVAGLDPVILICALQAVYSRCWPERFSYRPIERFWRLAPLPREKGSDPVGIVASVSQQHGWLGALKFRIRRTVLMTKRLCSIGTCFQL